MTQGVDSFTQELMSAVVGGDEVAPVDGEQSQSSQEATDLDKEMQRALIEQEDMTITVRQELNKLVQQANRRVVSLKKVDTNSYDVLLDNGETFVYEYSEMGPGGKWIAKYGEKTYDLSVISQKETFLQSLEIGGGERAETGMEAKKPKEKCPSCGSTHIEKGICQNCRRKLYDVKEEFVQEQAEDPSGWLLPEGKFVSVSYMEHQMFVLDWYYRNIVEPVDAGGFLDKVLQESPTTKELSQDEWNKSGLPPRDYKHLITPDGHRDWYSIGRSHGLIRFSGLTSLYGDRKQIDKMLGQIQKLYRSRTDSKIRREFWNQAFYIDLPEEKKALTTTFGKFLTLRSLSDIPKESTMRTINYTIVEQSTDFSGWMLPGGEFVEFYSNEHSPAAAEWYRKNVADPVEARVFLDIAEVGEVSQKKWNESGLPSKDYRYFVSTYAHGVDWIGLVQKNYGLVRIASSNAVNLHPSWLGKLLSQIQSLYRTELGKEGRKENWNKPFYVDLGGQEYIKTTLSKFLTTRSWNDILKGSVMTPSRFDYSAVEDTQESEFPKKVWVQFRQGPWREVIVHDVREEERLEASVDAGGGQIRYQSPFKKEITYTSAVATTDVIPITPHGKKVVKLPQLKRVKKKKKKKKRKVVKQYEVKEVARIIDTDPTVDVTLRFDTWEEKKKATDVVRLELGVDKWFQALSSPAGKRLVVSVRTNSTDRAVEVVNDVLARVGIMVVAEKVVKKKKKKKKKKVVRQYEVKEVVQKKSLTEMTDQEQDKEAEGMLERYNSEPTSIWLYTDLPIEERMAWAYLGADAFKDMPFRGDEVRRFVEALKTVVADPNTFWQQIEEKDKVRAEYLRDLDWTLEKLRFEDIGVYPHFGGFPREWSKGNLLDTSKAVASGEEKPDKRHKVLAMTDQWMTILKFLPPIVVEGGILRGRDKEAYNPTKWDVDDGNHRLVAAAIGGAREAICFVGRKKGPVTRELTKTATGGAPGESVKVKRKKEAIARTEVTVVKWDSQEKEFPRPKEAHQLADRLKKEGHKVTVMRKLKGVQKEFEVKEKVLEPTIVQVEPTVGTKVRIGQRQTFKVGVETTSNYEATTLAWHLEKKLGWSTKSDKNVLTIWVPAAISGKEAERRVADEIGKLISSPVRVRGESIEENDLVDAGEKMGIDVRELRDHGVGEDRIELLVDAAERVEKGELKTLEELEHFLKYMFDKETIRNIFVSRLRRVKGEPTQEGVRKKVEMSEQLDIRSMRDAVNSLLNIAEHLPKGSDVERAVRSWAHSSRLEFPTALRSLGNMAATLEFSNPDEAYDLRQVVAFLNERRMESTQEGITTGQSYITFVIRPTEMEQLTTKEVWKALQEAGAITSKLFKMQVVDKEEEFMQVSINTTHDAWQATDKAELMDEVGSVSTDLQGKVQERIDVTLYTLPNTVVGVGYDNEEEAQSVLKALSGAYGIRAVGRPGAGGDISVVVAQGPDRAVKWVEDILKREGVQMGESKIKVKEEDFNIDKKVKYKCGQCGKTGTSDDLPPICDKCMIEMVPAEKFEPVEEPEVREPEQYNKDQMDEVTVKSTPTWRFEITAGSSSEAIEIQTAASDKYWDFLNVERSGNTIVLEVHPTKADTVEKAEEYVRDMIQRMGLRLESIQIKTESTEDVENIYGPQDAFVVELTNNTEARRLAKYLTNLHQRVMHAETPHGTDNHIFVLIEAGEFPSRGLLDKLLKMAEEAGIVKKFEEAIVKEVEKPEDIVKLGQKIQIGDSEFVVKEVKGEGRRRSVKLWKEGWPSDEGTTMNMAQVWELVQLGKAKVVGESVKEAYEVTKIERTSPSWVRITASTDSDDEVQKVVDYVRENKDYIGTEVKAGWGQSDTEVVLMYRDFGKDSEGGLGKGILDDALGVTGESTMKEQDEEIPPYILQVHNAYLAAKEKGDRESAARFKKQLDQYIRQYNLDPALFKESVDEPKEKTKEEQVQDLLTKLNEDKEFSQFFNKFVVTGLDKYRAMCMERIVRVLSVDDEYANKVWGLYTQKDKKEE